MQLQALQVLEVQQLLHPQLLVVQVLAQPNHSVQTQMQVAVQGLHLAVKVVLLLHVSAEMQDVSVTQQLLMDYVPLQAHLRQAVLPPAPLVVLPVVLQAVLPPVPLVVPALVDLQVVLPPLLPLAVAYAMVSHLFVTKLSLILFVTIMVLNVVVLVGAFLLFVLHHHLAAQALLVVPVVLHQLPPALLPLVVPALAAAVPLPLPELSALVVLCLVLMVVLLAVTNYNRS